MGLRWRIVCLLIIATLQVLLVWAAIRFGPRRDWGHLAMTVFGTAALLVTGYELVQKGKPTRLTFCFWLGPFVTVFVRDIGRIWNRDPNVDPSFTLFISAVNIIFIILWIVMNPLGPKQKGLGINRRFFS
jgi:hypothetical protein